MNYETPGGALNGVTTGRTFHDWPHAIACLRCSTCGPYVDVGGRASYGADLVDLRDKNEAGSIFFQRQ